MGMFDSVIGRRVSPLLTTPSPVVPSAAMPSVDALLGALGGLSAPRPRPAPRLAPSLPAQSTAPAARSAEGFNPNPQLVAAIRATVPPQYQAAALATALVESGGRLDAVGDSGNSFGPYQMNRRGRLASAGYTPAQAQDPRLATTAFWNETGALARRYPGIDWADLMYRSQRPADREGYIAKLRQVMPAARQIVGGGGARPASEPTGQTLAARTTEGGGLSGDAIGALIRYAMQARDEALKGKAPSLEEALRVAAPLMQTFRRDAPQARVERSRPGVGVLPDESGLARPLATPMGRSAFGSVDAEGAEDDRGTRHHAAVDWFAPAGARVSAPVSGRVVEVKPSRGNSGQIFGGVVKVQDSSGRVFVFRHVDPRIGVGQQVQAGAPIATVSPWTGGSPHAHIEVWKTLGGGYDYENMIDPATIFG